MDILDSMTQTGLRLLAAALIGLFYLGFWVLRIVIIVAAGTLLLSLSAWNLWRTQSERLHSS